MVHIIAQRVQLYPWPSPLPFYCALFTDCSLTPSEAEIREDISSHLSGSNSQERRTRLTKLKLRLVIVFLLVAVRAPRTALSTLYPAERIPLCFVGLGKCMWGIHAFCFCLLYSKLFTLGCRFFTF